jgi:hypothetical protein
MKYENYYMPLVILELLFFIPLAVLYFILGCLDTIFGTSLIDVLGRFWSHVEKPFYDRWNAAYRREVELYMKRRKEEAQEMICDTCKHLAVGGGRCILLWHR